MLESPSPALVSTAVLILRPYLTASEIQWLRRRTVSKPEQYRARRTQVVAHLRFICQRLRFPPVVLHTAVGYFQRYYLRNRFQLDTYVDVLVACLFLAAKTCDVVKKCRDIVLVAQLVSPEDCAPVPGYTVLLTRVEDQRRRVLRSEQRLLAMMGFDFRPPVGGSGEAYLVRFLKHMMPDGETVVGRHVKQLAFIIHQDLLYTDVLLTYPPNVRALVCIKVALQVASHYPAAEPSATLLDNATAEALLETIDTQLHKTYSVPAVLHTGAYRQVLRYYVESYPQLGLSKHGPELPVFHDLYVKSEDKGRVPREPLEAALAKDPSLNVHEEGEVTHRYMWNTQRERFDQERTQAERP